MKPSKRGSAIENFDILLGMILGQCRPFHSFNVANTDQFMTRMHTVPVNDSCLQFSLDIESMFPSLPTGPDAVQVVVDHLTRHRKELNLFGFEVRHVGRILRFVLDNIILKANGLLYRKLNGVGTGYHSSVAYAEIINHENFIKAIDVSTPMDGLSVYVDDCWALWNGTREQLDDFVAKLNSFWPGLKYVLTLEDDDKSIVFLDVRITRLDRSLKTVFYRKETHSGNYLHFTSHCPITQKMNIVRNETRRIIGNCTQRSDADSHLNDLRSNLRLSGYPEAFIRQHMQVAMSPNPTETNRARVDDNLPIFSIPYVSEAFTRIVKKELSRNAIEARVVVKSAGNLQSRFHRALSPPCNCPICNAGIPCCARHVIYDAECKFCRQHYNGVTTRPFAKRFGEHEASIRFADNKSALSDHFNIDTEDQTACQNPDRSIWGYNWKVLDRGRTYKDSFIREGVAINSDNPTINRNAPGWVKYTAI